MSERLDTLKQVREMVEAKWNKTIVPYNDNLYYNIVHELDVLIDAEKIKTFTVTFNVENQVTYDKQAMKEMRKLADEKANGMKFIDMKVGLCGDDYVKNRITLNFIYKNN